MVAKTSSETRFILIKLISSPSMIKMERLKDEPQKFKTLEILTSTEKKPSDLTGSKD